MRNLSRSLKFDLDNPCDFLPQEKIVEFASLSPEFLLQETERAVEPGLLDYQSKVSALTAGLARLREHCSLKRSVLGQLERNMARLLLLEQSYQNVRWERLRLVTAIECICVGFGRANYVKTKSLFIELTRLRNEYFKQILPSRQEHSTVMETLNTMENLQYYLSSHETAYSADEGSTITASNSFEHRLSAFSKHSQNLKLELEHHVSL